jgi:hypothetical protein
MDLVSYLIVGSIRLAGVKVKHMTVKFFKEKSNLYLLHNNAKIIYKNRYLIVNRFLSP